MVSNRRLNNNFAFKKQIFHSENPFTSSSGVDFTESTIGTFVKDSLGFEALVLIETVSLHAITEASEFDGAQLLENGLSWRTFIFTRESKFKSNVRLIICENLPGDLFIDESRLL